MVSSLYQSVLIFTANKIIIHIMEFTNGIDPDEVAHNEPPHLELHCLPSSPLIFNKYSFEERFSEIWNIAKFVSSSVKVTWQFFYYRYMLQGQENQDPLESFLTRLVNDAVKEASTSVVKETVREMAREYVEYKHVDEVLDDLMTDYLSEIGQELV